MNSLPLFPVFVGVFRVMFESIRWTSPVDDTNSLEHWHRLWNGVWFLYFLQILQKIERSLHGGKSITTLRSHHRIVAIRWI